MKIKSIISCALMLMTLSVFSQPTRINVATLLRSGPDNTFLVTDQDGNVAWRDAQGILIEGTGIEIAANKITNLAPDQTVTLTGSGIASITGSYPNFNVEAIEVDGSVTNEINQVSVSGSSTRTVTLSNGGGSFSFSAGPGISIGGSGSDISITSSATAPTLSIERYEEVLAADGNSVTVSGFVPAEADTLVFADGVHLDWGAGEDMTLSGSTINFSQTFPAGTKVLAKKITVN